jgi:hypothetical protein
MKNMKNKIFIAVVILLLSMIVIVYISGKKQLKIDIEKCKQEYVSTTLMCDNLLEEQITLLENENKFFDPKLVLTNVKLEQNQIGEMNLDKTYLVMFFSSSFCSNCVNYSLDEIKSFLNEYKIKNILLLASNYMSRDLYVFAQTNKFDPYSFYSIETLNLPIEHLQMPFYFLLNKNLNISHFFIPRKETPEQTKKYFETIKNIIIN